jgi:uncharacterized membrane protein YagU involved in acid resistance
VDWLGWLTFGVAATVLLTGIMVTAQLAGWSRMDMPMLLGTMFVADPDRARLVGFLMHLVMGQLFALFYMSAFVLLGTATWWLGALFGLFHGLAALTILVRVVVGVHPRMASDRSGPEVGGILEPPGLLGLNYGRQTPLFALIGHLAYGMVLGGFLSAG